MKNKVLVTGSCGFIGHHLVKELKLRGFYVIGADNLYGGDKKYADLSDEFLLKNCGDLRGGWRASLKVVRLSRCKSKDTCLRRNSFSSKSSVPVKLWITPLLKPMVCFSINETLDEGPSIS